MLSVEHAERMAARDEHQGTIELINFIEEDRHIHRTCLRHEVVGLPGAIVLVPLPEVTLEGHLAVDLKLMHVDGLAEDLHDRLYHARMARQLGERLAIQVCGEVGAHGITALLTHVLRPMLGIEMRHLVKQDLHLLGGKQAREEEIAVAVELLDLGARELHCVSFCDARRPRTAAAQQCSTITVRL